MKSLSIVLLLLVTATAFAQNQSQPLNTLFTAEKKWMILPVKNGAPKKRVEIWHNGQLARYIDIELAEDAADWNSYLDISQWKGKELDLRVNQLKQGSKTFAPVLQSDDDKNDGTVYKEKYRGQFHFSPKRGWMNDPNGLVYYNGEYHLFFQHNPYGTEWGNMHWGHAVSKDLLHWQEIGEALYPGECGTIFSGSAIVDSNNSSGLGKDGKAPMVLFYTCDRSWTQGIAWSNDGRNFEKPDYTVVPRFAMGNRDPKVIWHAPTKKWVMVFWSETNAAPLKQTMRFYSSTNLKDWTYMSSVTAGPLNDNYLFECPEFYELPVEGGKGEKKWVLTAANSAYAIGSFDGTTFTPEVERLQAQHGRDYYASQTYNNEPKGRRVEIGWWRTKTNIENMPFNMAQSIPMEVKLVKTDSGVRLARFPVKELESLRIKTNKIGKLTVSTTARDYAKLNLKEYELRFSLSTAKAGSVTINIHGKPLVIDAGKSTISFDGVTAPVSLVNGMTDFVVYVDRVGIELFTGDGLLFMPVNVNLDMNNPQLSFVSSGGQAKIENLVVYELGSIWE